MVAAIAETVPPAAGEIEARIATIQGGVAAHDDTALEAIERNTRRGTVGPITTIDGKIQSADVEMFMRHIESQLRLQSRRIR